MNWNEKFWFEASSRLKSTNSKTNSDLKLPIRLPVDQENFWFKPSNELVQWIKMKKFDFKLLVGLNQQISGQILIWNFQWDFYWIEFNKFEVKFWLKPSNLISSTRGLKSTSSRTHFDLNLPRSSSELKWTNSDFKLPVHFHWVKIHRFQDKF